MRGCQQQQKWRMPTTTKMEWLTQDLTFPPPSSHAPEERSLTCPTKRAALERRGV